MNTCVILLVTALIIAVCNSTSVKTNGYIEESENFVAPQLNLWKILNKSKGKLTLKNLLFQKSDISGKKQMHRENIDINHPMAVELSTEKLKDLENSTPQIKRDNDRDKINDKVSANSPDSYVEYSKVIPSLHLEIEPNKKFVHSIVDGWTF